MATELLEIIKQYEYLRNLAQTDGRASANGAAQSYASDVPLLINEVIRLSNLVVSGSDLLTDIQAELTAELDAINRRSRVEEWLEQVSSEE